MLPRLLDATGFQSAANMSADEFAHAAMSGMVPRAAGMLANVPLWPEHIVQTFCKEVGRVFNDAWNNGNGFATGFAVANSLVVDALTTDRAHAAPVVEMPQREWPDEMTRTFACEYTGATGGFLDKHVASGLLNSRKDGMFVIFKRADLDAFMELPIFKYRKRIGYTGGKPNGNPTTFTRTPKGMEKPTLLESPNKVQTGGFTLLSEKAAADHLNMHPEVLAIARRDALGPANTMVNGNPCYRVADLDAWKALQDEKTPVAMRAAAGDAELLNSDAAEYLGVTTATMGYWRGTKIGPPVSRRHGAGKGSRIYYRVADLEQFKRTHGESIKRSQAMHNNPNVQGGGKVTTGRGHSSRKKAAAAKAGARNGHANGKTRNTGPMHPRAVTSPAPNGTRVRH